MGNVTQRQDNNLGLTENIYYDNDYRFSYSKLNGTQNLSVTYDPTGNITSRSDVAGGASWTYDPNHKHEVTQAGSSGFQYSYDNDGNAITRQGSTISWSSYNYPTTVNAGSGSTAETVAFSYGPDRQRWQQMYTGNSTQETTNYIGGLLEVVASGSVTDYRHYITVFGEQIAVYSRKSSGTNTFSYLLSDHEASVASITSSSGSQVVGESFDAFGSRRNSTTWSGAPSSSDLTTIAGVTREGYTFQTALGLWMGMNHMNGRVEDSVTGRFLSADPNVPDWVNTQSYNRYSYVNNNPMSRIDPSGFDDAPANNTYVKPIDPPPTVVVTASPYAPGTTASYSGYDPNANGGLANPAQGVGDGLPTITVTGSKKPKPPPLPPPTLQPTFAPVVTLGACAVNIGNDPAARQQCTANCQQQTEPLVLAAAGTAAGAVGGGLVGSAGGLAIPGAIIGAIFGGVSTFIAAQPGVPLGVGVAYGAAATLTASAAAGGVTSGATAASTVGFSMLGGTYGAVAPTAGWSAVSAGVASLPSVTTAAAVGGTFAVTYAIANRVRNSYCDRKCSGAN